MTRLLESTFIDGRAGRLEALVEGPDDATSIGRVAVICHPHPLHGGTMHNKVVFRLARAAREASATVVRFNFRGVGQSAGAYDGGIGEQDDLRAALRFASERYPGIPLVAEGFSFGSRIGLRVVCDGDSDVERFLAVGTPVGHGEWDFLAECRCPIRYLHSTNDEHGRRSTMEAVFAKAAEPKTLTWIEASDHFFSDALDELEQAAREGILTA